MNPPIEMEGGDQTCSSRSSGHPKGEKSGCWRPRQNSDDCQFSEENQAPQRDTSALSGSKENNGLADRLGHAQAECTADAWASFGVYLASSCEPCDRAGLAWAALLSLDPQIAEKVALLVIHAASPPLPPLFAPMRDARYWAGGASRAELKAYALAAFERMTARDRAAFLQHITEQGIAA